MAEARGYRPIEHYAAIGDCHGSALVAQDGSVDWCCFGRFDADPLLCRILDAHRGGFLMIAPRGAYEISRAYLPGTNVLRTEFISRTGRVAITDFMALGRAAHAGANDYVSVVAPGWLVRCVEVFAGSVELDVECRATLGFGVRAARLDGKPHRVEIEASGHAIHTDIDLTIEDDLAKTRAKLAAGDRRYVVLAPKGDRVDARTVATMLAITTAYWREWCAYSRYVGPYQKHVERSALVLKLMTFPPTGACVAAPTTSLPEQVGGERNWDYRFCWIRDASLMLHALAALGYSAESDAFFGYLCDLMAGGIERMQVMYGIGGEAGLAERELDLEGYRGSRPVRVGNGAHVQSQIDLYGYLLEGGLIYRTLGGRLARGDRDALAAVADFIETCWFRPDTGIWEVRGRMRHFVHSKAMCWIVVDRAIKLLGTRPQWIRLRDRIWRDIVEKGIDREGGHLLQSFDAKDPGEVDAALLQLAVLGLPLDVETIRRTRLAVERHLMRGDFIDRYRTEDGLRGDEGAFLVCSFWHVDALLAEGERRAAGERFERLLAVANDVGLYSEEYDPANREFLGNFPQAFTHLGLVNTAVNIAIFDRYGAGAVRAGYAERARLSVKATFGWRGVLAALMSTGRVRLVSSRASQLDLRRAGLRG